MARLVLTEAGEDAFLGGNVTVIGTTSGGEVITVVGGTVTLDPSFNAGGDAVILPGAASSYTIRISGSVATLVGADVTISIPVGAAGLRISFEDVSRTLAFDPQRGAAKLGDQIITRLEEAVAGTSPVQPATISGTNGADTINGTPGADVIDGLDGDDTINGGDGSDIVRGGLGNDSLRGGPGSDEIHGGSGDDVIVDAEGQTILVDGGSGNDNISVGSAQVTSAIVTGGAGDDVIDAFLGTMGYCSINAGSGADVVTIRSQGMGAEVYLGLGRDKLVLAEGVPGTAEFGGVAVRDFETGASGDTIDLSNLLTTYLSGWDGSSDPFSTGHLRLVESLGAITLQVDRDGKAGSAGFTDLIFFEGVDIEAFTSENFNGWNPDNALQAASSVQESGEVSGTMWSQDFAVDAMALASSEPLAPLAWQSGHHFIA